MNPKFDKIKQYLRIIANNKYFLLGFIVIVLISFPIYIHHNETSKIFPSWYRFITDLSLGTWASLTSSFTFSWVIYFFRIEIKQWFGLSNPLSIRIPLMAASSPFLVAKKFKLFEKNDLDIELDFRYAGINTLSDLNSNICDLAVASDIALIRFINDNYSFKVYSLPFVKITNHIKLLVAKDSEIKCVSDLANKKVALIKDSVHEDFIDTLCQQKSILVDKIEATGIIECYILVIDKKADACIFWEPHYLSMEKIFELKQINCDLTYEWFLCLVGKLEFVNSNKNISRQIFHSLQDAVKICESDHSKVADNCITYMHPEFTGLDKPQLNSLFDKSTLDSHKFEINANMKLEYLNRLKLLYNNPSNKYKADNAIQDFLWPIFKELKHT